MCSAQVLVNQSWAKVNIALVVSKSDSPGKRLATILDLQTEMNAHNPTTGSHGADISTVRHDVIEGRQELPPSQW